MKSWLTPLEAIHAARLIAVAGNPLKRVTPLTRVGFVMTEGTVYKGP